MSKFINTSAEKYHEKTLSDIFVTKKKLSLDMIESLKDDIKNHHLVVQPPFHEYKEEIKWMSLRDICEIKRGTVKGRHRISGEYKFMTGRNKCKTHISYSHDCEAIVYSHSEDLSKCYISYVNGKFAARKRAWVITTKDNNIKYIQHYMSDHFAKSETRISPYRFKELKIPILSLDVQEQFVEFYEDKAKKIKEYEEAIKSQKNCIKNLDIQMNMIKNNLDNA